MIRNPIRLTSLLMLTASIYAADKPPKIKKDDIPKNEKQMWKSITASQRDIEENLMSGDPRFTTELGLTRRKVADLMLNAEGDKKNKAVVSDLSRCWNYWTRESDEIVVEDLKEYNLATAAGKSFDPADNNPQGGNPYIGMPVQPVHQQQQYVSPQPVYAPQQQYPAQYQQQPQYSQQQYVEQPIEYHGIRTNEIIGPDGHHPNDGLEQQVAIGFTWKKGFYEKTPQNSQPTQRSGSAYRGTGTFSTYRSTGGIHGTSRSGGGGRH